MQMMFVIFLLFEIFSNDSLITKQYYLKKSCHYIFPKLYLQSRYVYHIYIDGISHSLDICLMFKCESSPFNMTETSKDLSTVIVVFLFPDLDKSYTPPVLLNLFIYQLTHSRSSYWILVRL